jgi:hypothetical protein
MKCEECLLEDTHTEICQTRLRLRLEALLVKHPKLKFQLTKLTQVPIQGSYPVYVAHLVAPFVVEQGSTLEGTFERHQVDARAPIRMTKAELNNEAERDRVFSEKRIVATHLLLDFVEAGEVPCRVAGQAADPIQVTEWGTVEDLYPETVN